MEPPKAVKALGVVCTAFGFAGIVGLGPNLPALTGDLLATVLQGGGDPEQRQFVAVVLTLFTTALLMILAGIGLLLFKPWGRWAGIAYAIVAIAGLGLITWVEAGAIAELTAAAEEGAEIPHISWISKLISLIIPVLTLYVLTLPDVVRAFHGQKQNPS